MTGPSQPREDCHLPQPAARAPRCKPPQGPNAPCACPACPARGAQRGHGATGATVLVATRILGFSRNSGSGARTNYGWRINAHSSCARQAAALRGAPPVPGPERAFLGVCEARAPPKPGFQRGRQLAGPPGSGPQAGRHGLLQPSRSNPLRLGSQLRPPTSPEQPPWPQQHPGMWAGPAGRGGGSERWEAARSEPWAAPTLLARSLCGSVRGCPPAQPRPDGPRFAQAAATRLETDPRRVCGRWTAACSRLSPSSAISTLPTMTCPVLRTGNRGPPVQVLGGEAQPPGAPGDKQLPSSSRRERADQVARDEAPGPAAEAAGGQQVSPEVTGVLPHRTGQPGCSRPC